MLWRRFLVRSDGTLADLLVVLQIGFDWTDFHLHRFRSFLYEYDFGDLWQHQVRIEKRLGVETSRSYPVCVGGQWAGPPEDCGGDHEHFWIGVRLRRGESESCLTTYWKTSKPAILKLSSTGSRICSLGKSGSCCIALTGAE